ncbi:hypothetical protein HDF26_004021 [Pedobacter cryoconitis]|uniref:OB-fold protein n=1 Tax=Pedobacter cryoconitis TaxID=188932 RepID=UPI0016196F9A|nr:hypothetical protein [Pedobacter cryoconitis]MBB6273561.1 hypothetical protein [Pedobacter cryoconitis]
MSKHKNLIIIIATVIITTICTLVYIGYKEWHPSEINDDVADTTSMSPQIQSEPSFLQIANLYDDYRSNKVAFDKKYNDRAIEFEGSISEITNRYGCAGITFNITSGNDTNLGIVICNNCPADVDHWSNEVAKLNVGQKVKIKGFYSGNLSDGSSIFFYKCHVLK